CMLRRAFVTMNRLVRPETPRPIIHWRTSGAMHRGGLVGPGNAQLDPSSNDINLRPRQVPLGGHFEFCVVDRLEQSAFRWIIKRDGYAVFAPFDQSVARRKIKSA